jgi:hypothetical protein
MATYRSDLLNDFFRRQSQRRALTGLPSSYQETRGTMDSALAYDAQRARDAGLLGERKSEFDRTMALQEQTRRDQRSANTVSGVGQVAMLAAAYKSANGLGLFGGTKAAPVAGSATTVAPVTGGSTGGLLGSGAGATTAQGAVAPVATGTTAQGSAVLGASAPEAAAGTGMGEGLAATYGAESAGLLGTAGTVAGPAALGAGIGMFGMSKLTGAGKPGHQGGEVATSNIAGGIIGGAIAGAMATSWSGPGAIVGGVIGGIIGGISSLF